MLRGDGGLLLCVFCLFNFDFVIYSVGLSVKARRPQPQLHSFVMTKIRE